MSRHETHSATRRTFLKSLAAPAIASVCPLSAMASTFPERPITLICPFGAGGSVDQYMRVLSKVASQYFQRGIIVENKPGTGGALSTALVARAKPDGYTLAMLSGSAYRAPWLNPSVGYSPITDLSYVIGMTSLEFCAVVRKDSAIKTFADFMRLGKEKAGHIRYAAGDPTTSVPVSMVSIQKKYGVSFQHIPYKSGSDMAVAIMGGHVDVVIDSIGTYVPYLKRGELRLIAALGEQRFKSWPDVPTALEQGYEVVLSAPLGLAGPAGIPADRIALLHDGFRKAMLDPEIAAVLDTLNQPEWYKNPQEFKTYGNQAYHDAGKLLKTAGIIQ